MQSQPNLLQVLIVIIIFLSMEKFKDVACAGVVALATLGAQKTSAQTALEASIGTYAEEAARSAKQMVAEAKDTCPERGDTIVFAYNENTNALLCLKKDGSFDFANNPHLQEDLTALAQIVKYTLGRDLEIKITFKNNLGSEHISDPDIYEPLATEFVRSVDDETRLNALRRVMANEATITITSSNDDAVITSFTSFYPDGQNPAVTFVKEQIK